MVKKSLKPFFSSRKNIVILCVCFLILVVAVFGALEIFHVIDLVHKNNGSSLQQTGQSKPVNTIDYTPATDTEKSDPTINSAKNPTPTPTSASASAINLIITRAGQNSTDKSIYVGALIQGASSGTCTLELTQNGSVIYTAVASIIRQNSLYTCDGFLVNITSIPTAGDVAAKVTINNGLQSATSTQIINNVVK
jgi:hypothetical protein